MKLTELPIKAADLRCNIIAQHSASNNIVSMIRLLFFRLSRYLSYIQNFPNFDRHDSIA